MSPRSSVDVGRFPVVFRCSRSAQEDGQTGEWASLLPSHFRVGLRGMSLDSESVSVVMAVAVSAGSSKACFDSNCKNCSITSALGALCSGVGAPAQVDGGPIARSFSSGVRCIGSVTSRLSARRELCRLFCAEGSEENVDFELAEEKAKMQADVKAKKEAEEKAKKETKMKAEKMAEEKARKEAEEKAKTVRQAKTIDGKGKGKGKGLSSEEDNRARNGPVIGMG
jgi:hypothetical protein